MVNHSICELRASGNQIQTLPNIEMDNLENLDLKSNKILELPACLGGLAKIRKIVLDDNQVQVIPGFFGSFSNLSELSMAKNRISQIQDDALANLANLVMLDLHQNQLTTFSSVPNSQKLDQILLSYNQLSDIQNLSRAPKLTVLDLHNNKLDILPESICELFFLKTLTISNNNLSDINPKLSLLDHLVRLTIEGNPLRSIKPNMRTAGAVQLKKFLQMRLGDEDIKKAEQNQAKILGTPGATKGDEDPWEFLLREFVVNNTQLDLRGKELNIISPILWERYPNIQVLDLSQNPIQIPEGIGMLDGLKTLRL